LTETGDDLHSWALLSTCRCSTYAIAQLQRMKYYITNIELAQDT
jgi:hypothetical protein